MGVVVVKIVKIRPWSLALCAVLSIPLATAPPRADQRPPAAEPTAVARAAAIGQPVEIPELTTETGLTVANPNGTLTRTESAMPVRVRDVVSGRWRPVDLTLVRRPDGSVGPAAAPVAMAFSGGGTTPMARVGDGDTWLAFGWPGPLPTPTLSGATATYRDVLPDVDLLVEAGTLGFRELLVVRTRRGASNPALETVRFAVSSHGLSLGADASGALRAVDGQGRPVLAGSAPRMWDTAVDERAAARSAPMRLRLDGSSLSILPDRRLLSDPAARFPIVIDPAVTSTRHRTYWTMVWSNGQEFPNSSTEHARVGYDGWSSAPKRSRSFFRFDTTSLANKHIISAVFAHKQIHSPNFSCTATSYGPSVQLYRTGSISSSTTWSNQPSWADLLDTSGTVHGHEDYCAGYDRQEWNAEAAVEYAASHSSSTLTLGLKSSDETDRDGWRKYDNDSNYPNLYVEYNSKPNTPKNVRINDPSAPCSTDPAKPAGINSLTPKFEAELTDADGSRAELKGHFEVYELDGTEVFDFVNSGEYASPKVVYAPMTSPLNDGQTYKWRVRAEEYIAESTDTSAWYHPTSGYCYLKVDTSQPPPPTVSSTAYPEFDPDNQVASGGEGQPGAFTFTAGVTDVTAYLWMLNDAPAWLSKPTTAGSPVTVNVVPDRFGLNRLYVKTRDGAGNESINVRQYNFLVARGRAPVGIWNLDETAGNAADTSGNGRTATVSGGIWGGVGRGGTSLTLDGIDDYAATAGPVVNTTGSFTVAAWVRLDQLGNKTIVSQGGTTASAFALSHSTGNGWSFSRYATDTGSPAGVRARSSYAPSAWVWTHLAGVYDATNSQLRLYVNGVLDPVLGTATFTTPWSAAGALNIGRLRFNGAFSEYADGKIDQVQIWDRVAGPDEIAELVHLIDPTTGQPRPALIGHWQLDELSGIVADDATPYSKDLTLQAGASFVADGQRGRVMRLDGASTGWAVAVGRQLDATGSFTLTAWVNLASATDTGMVLAAPGAAENAYQLEFTGGLWGFTRHAADAASSTRTRVSSVDAAEVGAWTHLAVVYDAPAQRMFLYVNGVRQGDDDGVAFTTPWQTVNQLRVGWGIDNGAAQSTYAAGGLYDEIRVYAGILSQQDIFALAAS